MKTNIKYVTRLYTVGLLMSTVACSNGAEFRGASGTKNILVSRSADVVEVEPPAKEPVIPPQVIEPAPEPQPEPEPAPYEPVSITYAVPEPLPVDYLFVIDNSASMANIIDKVKSGLTQIGSEGKFPLNSRVGFITTATDAHDRRVNHINTAGLNYLTEVKCREIYEDLTISQQEIDQMNNGVDGLEKDKIEQMIERYCPSVLLGYSNLIDREAISQSARVNKEDFPGCDAWFAPTDKDVNEKSCIESVSNIEISGISVEAGITALDTFIEKSEDKFREKALVNVIFVSDTHDPGDNYIRVVPRRLNQNLKYIGDRVDIDKDDPQVSLQDMKDHEIVLKQNVDQLNAAKQGASQSKLREIERLLFENERDYTMVQVFIRAMEVSQISVYNDIKSKMQVDISNLKFHGVIPQQSEADVCVSDDKHHENIENGYTYDKLVKGSKGVQISQCNEADRYLSFIEDMIVESVHTEVVFKIPEGISTDIEKVKVNGVEEAFTVDQVEATIRLTNFRISDLQDKGVEDLKLEIYELQK